jgi:phosphate starvation-inducible protein PhoH and related proteins
VAKSYRRPMSVQPLSFAPKTETQRKFHQAIKDNTISFGLGFPGTGKSYVALHNALKALESGEVEQILILRPMVTVGKEIGFLPGTEEEKLESYVRHIVELLGDMVNEQYIEDLIDQEKIVFRALAFLRGANFKNTFVVVDEAQNLTKEDCYMVLTRICEGTKIVLVGDTGQKDIRYSGLEDCFKRTQYIAGISVTFFTVDDCVRSPIVKEILRVYYD